ncbi:MAG TPA: flagellar basal body rod protein FlgB [Nitrospiraceae bacterium]|nr:flagellar basal body rod protein FlgB [Nitrospiraceae bacterium]
MKIFDTTMSLLEKTMDLRDARHRIIASNIANEETPGYRAHDLTFQDALSAASKNRPAVVLQATHVRHIGLRGDRISQVDGRVSTVPVSDLPLDANSVNLELEMAKLSENAMQYNTATTMVAQRFRQLLSAIRETR